MDRVPVRIRLSQAAFAATLLFALGFIGNLPATGAETETRNTDFPSAAAPDQVCLTWSGDPCTTQTVQWRTSPDVKSGLVQFREKTAPEDQCRTQTAEMTTLETPDVANDPVNHRFTAVLDGLKPATDYTYRVGSETAWSDWHEFNTAPGADSPFSFIYVGDPQVGHDKWGQLLESAQKRCPAVAFYVVAGDNVNRGDNRDEWDALFRAADNIFECRPYVPAVGNHDCKNVGPKLLTGLVALPENGPSKLHAERTYRFDYGNAMFLVLDSNLPADAQAPWVEEQLKSSKATWKFAVCHHPAYSSSPKRDNAGIREVWGALFDKYHVDMALQGHDHGYLRTKPMRAGTAVASPAEGTVYTVAVSGTKLYDVGQFDYAAKVLDHKSTYQVIDIRNGNENRLTYRACDIDGNVLDEMVIVK